MKNIFPAKIITADSKEKFESAVIVFQKTARCGGIAERLCSHLRFASLFIFPKLGKIVRKHPLFAPNLWGF